MVKMMFFQECHYNIAMTAACQAVPRTISTRILIISTCDLILDSCHSFINFIASLQFHTGHSITLIVLFIHSFD